MNRPLLSGAWYRLADMKPRLRSHAQIHRHTYRGQDWYVLQDHATGRFHRFNPPAYFVVGLMDGRRSMDAIWEAASERFGDDAPTQDEMIGLISLLHRSDVLQADVIPDVTDLQRRYLEGRRNRMLSYMRSPFAVRFPFFDPDRLLSRTERIAHFCFAWPGAVIWLMVVSSAVMLAALHWETLSTSVADRVLGFENLFLIGFIYPVVKIFHEFGHAYGVRRWGGEVHEMGIMLLVFVPIPYVDASASLAFREKYKRIAVGAAGILVEVFLAGLAMWMWYWVEPGVVRAVAFQVMLIAGVSTLLFNGNPLLRFDAYYILSDVLEIPNLGSRGSRFLGYLFQRYALGLKQVHSPGTALGEKVWLSLYGVCSFAYRIFIMAVICVFVASQFLAGGMLITLWAVGNMVGTPLYRAIRLFRDNPGLRQRRKRTLAILGAGSVFLACLVLIVPFPLITVVEGVIWAPEQAEVRTEVDGIITDLLVVSGTSVPAGEPLIRCENVELRAQIRVLEANLKAVQAEHRSVLLSDPAQANRLKDVLQQLETELAHQRDQLAALTIRSRSTGVFLLPRETDLPGRFVRRGSHLGFVVDFNRATVRVVVAQEDVGLIRRQTKSVEVRFLGQRARALPSDIIREVPEASAELPSLALSLEGGGGIALDPADRFRAYESYFQFEIDLPEGVAKRIGERVFVRFVHEAEPLIYRWYRSARRLLLRQFDI